MNIPHTQGQHMNIQNNLWLLPIEPIAERYTKEWYDYMPSLFEGQGFNVQVIDGCETSGQIKTGSFLDANETVAYKASQLQSVARLFADKKVLSGDVFFVYDIEFWGIEVLRVLARMNKVSVRLVGFLHACSYTKGDAMEQMSDFQVHTERGWFEAFDLILVGSDYQKERLVFERGVEPNKIAVTGNPMFAQAYPLAEHCDLDKPREKILLISNRFDKEKRPDESLSWALVASHLYGYKVIVCTSRKDLNSNSKDVQDMAEQLEQQGLIEIRRGLTKRQYHGLLTQARIVLTNSEEESFGYCIHEAQMHGAIVIAKPYACHPQFVNSKLLANSVAEFTSILEMVDQASVLRDLAQLENVAVRIRQTITHNALPKAVLKQNATR